jgi:1,2-diacylglycerol 3-alpha-glucosyltransferase
MRPRVALLCSGLGNVFRGHEAFARGLIDLLGDDVDLTVFKGGGTPTAREVVLPHVRRSSAGLATIRIPVSAKWLAAAAEDLRVTIENESFAWAALDNLLNGQFDIIHCLDRETANLVYSWRPLFAQTPRVLYSNGGAIPARHLPQCDFVQEHSAHNLQYSDRKKAFLIPHGVNLGRFSPGIKTSIRTRLGIPTDAKLLISVGLICHSHKRADHVIREVAASSYPWHLLLVGQDGSDGAAIRALASDLLGHRFHSCALPHDELPEAYAAADAFVLGSLFETFGIVYIEAMAMGLPVISTHHPNQRGIVQGGGLFVDMKRPGALAALLSQPDAAAWAEVGCRGRAIVEAQYDLKVLKRQYLQKYAEIAQAPVHLPAYGLKQRLRANARGLWERVRRAVDGQAE